jgi:hypothetical protein
MNFAGYMVLRYDFANFDFLGHLAGAIPWIVPGAAFALLSSALPIASSRSS